MKVESTIPLNRRASDALLHVDYVVLPISDAAAFTLAIVVSHLGLSLAAAGAFIDNWHALWDWDEAPHVYLYFLLALAGVFWFGAVLGHYGCSTPLWRELQQVSSTVLLLALANLALDGLFRIEVVLPWWLATWGTLLFTIPASRYLCKRALLRKGFLHKPTIIIGDGPNARAAEKALRSESMVDCDFVGFVAPASVSDAPHNDVTPGSGNPDKRSPADLQHVRVVLALESCQDNLVDPWIRSLILKGVADMWVVPPVKGIPLHGARPHHFRRHEVLILSVRNNLARPIQRRLKRAFDVGAAMALALLLSPLLLGIWWRIHKDGGQAIFSHERVGQGGRRFKCYKFRTMVPDAKARLDRLLATSSAAREEWERDFKLKDDPRVTPVGNFLRRTSLDELPQLWNVIKGDMSLVGPRPIVEAELERYGDDVVYYYLARPGLTGVWQTSGRNDLDYPTRVYLDVWYLKNWSLWYDLAILLKTCPVLMKKSGAY
jgi:Undecaprenyl-phosphate galactose phosphotransferase WbaP